MNTMVYILRNPFTKLSILANSRYEDFMYINTVIPYETESIELLTDSEIGQYMGGN